LKRYYIPGVLDLYEVSSLPPSRIAGACLVKGHALIHCTARQHSESTLHNYKMRILDEYLRPFARYATKKSPASIHTSPISRWSMPISLAHSADLHYWRNETGANDCRSNCSRLAALGSGCNDSFSLKRSSSHLKPRDLAPGGVIFSFILPCGVAWKIGSRMPTGRHRRGHAARKGLYSHCVQPSHATTKKPSVFCALNGGSRQGSKSCAESLS
jgi:hypothetical protein